MADLTEDHISEIQLIIEARGVEMKELSYDLVDHVCCMIEEKMESGKSYTSALEESIASFGKKGIRQIQEEITFLLTKNILAMRKTGSHVIVRDYNRCR
jgi:anion-transporting  ArsA/GET3 family ATPase